MYFFFFFFGKESLLYFGCRQPGWGWGRRTPVQRPNPPLSPSCDNPGIRAFIGEGRGLHAETAQSALTVILKLVIDGLTSVILVVISTVNLQFQGWFVSISFFFSFLNF